MEDLQTKFEPIGFTGGNKLAERGDRFLARLIDGLIMVAVAGVSALLGFALFDYGTLMFILLGIGYLGLVIYNNIYLVTVSGQTLGKKAMKIKIVKTDTGENGGFVTNFLLREFLNGIIANVVPFYGIVDVLFIFGRDYQCLHDKIAGTSVVKETVYGEI